jgi:hypothetical protein
LGYSTSQIASCIAIVDVTVRSHIAAIVRKLDVADRKATVRKLRADDDAAEPVEVLNGLARLEGLADPATQRAMHHTQGRRSRSGGPRNFTS